jgi:hypothetical protein
MSNTTKFYNIRDRYNRYKKAIKKVFQSKYYTDSSKSQHRKTLAENNFNNANLVQKNADKQQGVIPNTAAASLADPQLHVCHRLDQPR